MRKLLFALLLFPLFSLAQDPDYNPDLPIDTLSHRIDYSEVVRLDSLSKAQIYTSAHDFLLKQFDLTHAVISYEDYPSGKIMARGTIFAKYIKAVLSVGVTISFDFIISVKEGKYKYELTNFSLLDGLKTDLLPDWHSADLYINDPSYRDKKGHFSGTTKSKLQALDGNIRNLIAAFKYDVSLKMYARPIESADF